MSNRTKELVAEFAQSVCDQNDAVGRDDLTTGNNCALNYLYVAKELIEQGQEGLNAFACLLNDPRIDVRTMAAAFLIPFKTDESKAVLEFSSREFGPVALGAKIALQRWETEKKGVDLT